MKCDHQARPWFGAGRPPGRYISSPAAYYLEARLGAPRGKHPMLMDGAILLLVFSAGYGLRAWISARRRRDIRKARGN